MRFGKQKCQGAIYGVRLWMDVQRDMTAKQAKESSAVTALLHVTGAPSPQTVRLATIRSQLVTTYCLVGI